MRIPHMTLGDCDDSRLSCVLNSGARQRRGPPVTHPEPGHFPRFWSNGETDGRLLSPMLARYHDPAGGYPRRASCSRRARAAPRPRRRCASWSPIWGTIRRARAWSTRRGGWSPPMTSCSAAITPRRSTRSTAPSRRSAPTTISCWCATSRSIPHCEHHMMPFTGVACRLYAGRAGGGPLQARAPGRRLCAAPADAGASHLADHRPRSTRSSNPAASPSCSRPSTCACRCAASRSPGAKTITTQFTGLFRDDPAEQARFITLVRSPSR